MMWPTIEAAWHDRRRRRWFVWLPGAGEDDYIAVDDRAPKPRPKPRQIFLIHYQQGFPEKGDYTKPGRIEDRQRLFYEAKRAGQFLDALESWPEFHKVEAVYRVGVPNWEQIDPDTLPRGTITPATMEES